MMQCLFQNRWLLGLLIGMGVIGETGFSQSGLSLQNYLPPQYYGVWNRDPVGVDANPTNSNYNYLLGVNAELKWSQIQTTSNAYDFSLMQGILTTAAARNQKVYLNIDVGPDSPTWIYGNGVPLVLCNGKGAGQDWPDYSNTNYFRFYTNLIYAFAKFVRTNSLVGSVAFVQVKTGSTGDEVAYKGNPTNNANATLLAANNSPQWLMFRTNAFETFRRAFMTETNGPPIPLLFNNIEEFQNPDEWAWCTNNLGSGFGIKVSGFGRGYHLSGEAVDIDYEKKYLVNPQGVTMFCRSEMDQTYQNLIFTNESLAFYWSAVTALQLGHSVWDISQGALQDAYGNTNIQQTFRFFNRYAGQIYPATATNAFIALHDGLDSSDTNRFPEATYGVANGNDTNRYANICASNWVYGARMEDLYAAAQGQVYQRQSQNGYNDAGWQIWPSNYSRFITQFNERGTSVGWFRVGVTNGNILTNSPIYSRFARGFEHASGKDALYFSFENGLFSDLPAWVKFSVTYYDSVSNSTWQLRYDAGSNNLATALSVTNKGDATWKTVTVTVTNAFMQKNGSNSSDFALVNTDTNDDVFSLIEVQRSIRLAPVTIGSFTGNTINYSGGLGLQFVLLFSGDMPVPINTWVRAKTNSVTPGAFLLPAMGSSTQQFYRIKSE